MYAVQEKSDDQFPLKAIEYGVKSPSMGYCPGSQGSFGCTLLLSLTSFIFIAPFSQVPHHLHYLEQLTFFPLPLSLFPRTGIFSPSSSVVLKEVLSGQATGIT
ncbi:hypothetical protein TNCT_113081 [Trichonephila clavata]|uniref:Uncharacterized protein n=1 Tax=Trichonephila clavata TaxID=2740835 RepID=A0A8X6FWS4_TRICU|nr:hypothetical protein TNCT_408411 [Trichonephila clavata]GFQ93050.1 hypothetical protein TNCT_113081 [Trichonephila clavata]